jgi:hypothetical protein
LAFPKSKLLQWEQGKYEMLGQLKAWSFLKRILDEKVHNRRRPGRRFFGETFVATNVSHEKGWYGSFKWLISWPARQSSGYAGEYRAALKDAFPSVSKIPPKALGLRKLLVGKKPVPPDLWLIVNGEHRFIEVKLPGDTIRPTQIAGLAVIATCLPSKENVSVWLYNLHPEGERPDPIPNIIQAQYKEFCKACRRPNKHFL